MTVDTLFRAANALNHKRNQHLKSNHGLTDSQFDFLVALYAHHGPVSIGKLADDLDCGRANLTAISDKLEAAGWITRKHDTSDRRVVLVEVTEEKKGLLRKAMSDTQNFLAQWDKHLTPAAETLDELTARLAG